jgi:glucose/arabinose dehydrogenase
MHTWHAGGGGRCLTGDFDRLKAPAHLLNVGACALSSASHANPPRVVPKPPQAELSVPPEFKVKLFASDLSGPRRMRVAANGDILLTEITGGRVTVLCPSADGSGVASRSVFAAGLQQPYGLTLYPNATNPKWLYVAETNRIVRYAYSTGDRVARGAPELVVASLPHGGGHSTRDILFSPDGTRCDVSMGSASNAAEQMPKKSVDEAKHWETSRSLGAA